MIAGPFSELSVFNAKNQNFVEEDTVKKSICAFCWWHFFWNVPLYSELTQQNLSNVKYVPCILYYCWQNRTTLLKILLNIAAATERTFSISSHLNNSMPYYHNVVHSSQQTADSMILSFKCLGNNSLCSVEEGRDALCLCMDEYNDSKPNNKYDNSIPMNK